MSSPLLQEKPLTIAGVGRRTSILAGDGGRSMPRCLSKSRNSALLGARRALVPRLGLDASAPASDFACSQVSYRHSRRLGRNSNAGGEDAGVTDESVLYTRDTERVPWP